METFFRVSSEFILIFFFIIYSFYALLILSAVPSISRRFREVKSEDVLELVKSESLPSLAIVIPGYNVEDLISNTLNNMLTLNYPTKEIVFVNDGSKDGTLELIKKEFELVPIENIFPQTLQTAPIRGLYRSKIYPNLSVVDKENGGRSDALNAGINCTFATLFAAIDADTVLEKDAFLRMARPFFTDPNIIAQGGTLRVLNGCTIGPKSSVEKIEIPKKLISGIQVVEYLRAFLYGRLGWNSLGGNLIVSGAFGLFNRNRVIDVGGYDTKCIGEDFDLTMKLARLMREKKKKKSIMFVPDPLAWTIVPDTYKAISRQRARWHMGLCQVMWRNRDMFWNPKFGMTGTIGYPYMFFGELIEPIIELFGLCVMGVGFYLGIVKWPTLVVFFLLTWGFTTLLSLISVVMEISTFRKYRYLHQMIRLLWYTFLENFGYRQAYIWWRIKGFWKFFRGDSTW